MSRARYRETRPPAGFGFDAVWSQTLDGDRPYSHRVVPDGCIDLIWWPRTGGLQVAGPDTRPNFAELAPGDRLLGLRFRPGMAPPALGVPSDAVRDVRPELRELWGDDADRLADVLSEADDPAGVLAAAVARRIRAAERPPDPLAAALVAELARGSVREAADKLNLSDRQLRRRALASFGYPAKTLQRILRFQRAFTLVLDGAPAADAAYSAGYADQAHLAHEVRELSGVPLTGLLAARRSA